ncbi:DNA-directed RNA polymerase III subunit RPC5 isoform X2 [Phoenix dactylifera]|uniref:DNA-directed RNA polymerase III subunit RPC5 isoform X2 n=1 Tax=Phoenix dactylifera TaxID=42345 RepID=A0A8B9AR56_PHODC|nr:DNA-directed RNA polymerase III subunit RPC5 isoform X2 [Phoenix dactylifera]
MEDGDDKPFDPFASSDADLDMALDIDLPDSSRRSGHAPARPARFQPKIKGKMRADSATDPGPLPAPPRPPLAPIKKQDEDDVAMFKADEASQEPASSSFSFPNGAEEAESEPVEVDDGEDTVVREIDVFFTPAPLDEDTCLYVMQYPLRPSWRPYELDERCEEVRVKPKQSKIEVDLSLDVNSENYDRDVDEPMRIEKQTLSSSKASFATSYAVGILRGNQLHLNPVHAVVQLRPSMSHIDAGLQGRKHSAKGVQGSAKSTDEIPEPPKPSVRQGKKVSEDSNENINDYEPWISLEYHPIDSPFAERYHQKMAAEENNLIQFTMQPSDYVNTLCPGTSTDKKRTKGPPRRVLLSMPLEERLKKWLTEGSQVNRFDALMHLAPTNSEKDVLKVLQLHAYLVQGLWVTKSSLLYEGFNALARDRILFLFSTNPVIHSDNLKTLRSAPLKHILSPLAVERSVFSDWKFKEATDISFLKRYPDIVKEQECAWSSREEQFMDNLRRFGKNIHMMTKNSLSPNIVKNTGALGRVDPDANRSKEGTMSSAGTTMSSETRENLPRALFKIFQEKRVRSLNSIVSGLRDLAISSSSRPRDDAKTKALANAAKNGADAPLPELQSVISQVAANIHGLYVLKSMGNPTLDPLRNVVIDLFRGKEPNAKLKKQEISKAAEFRLKRNITDSEYNQVVNELCVSSKGAWVLRSDD